MHCFQTKTPLTVILACVHLGHTAVTAVTPVLCNIAESNRNSVQFFPFFFSVCVAVHTVCHCYTVTVTVTMLLCSPKKKKIGGACRVTATDSQTEPSK
jgi:hypothetical protein